MIEHMPNPKNRHRADVVAAIHKRGTSLSELARRNGLSDSALRVALSHPRRPSNIVIAKFLGIPLHAIWPEWFDEEGHRIRTIEPARTARRPSSQKRRAA